MFLNTKRDEANGSVSPAQHYSLNSATSIGSAAFTEVLQGCQYARLLVGVAAGKLLRLEPYKQEVPIFSCPHCPSMSNPVVKVVSKLKDVVVIVTGIEGSLAM